MQGGISIPEQTTSVVAIHLFPIKMHFNKERNKTKKVKKKVTTNLLQQSSAMTNGQLSPY
jgi:hypothetical protein